jgi:choline kinase
LRDRQLVRTSPGSTKAIILSAGQGRRLLPLTRSTPKCLLPVQPECSILEFQLRALARCGISQATVMVGFAAERVERAVAECAPPDMQVTTFFNPFYPSSDNLITTWLARPEMDGDFLLLNGDTLFDPGVLERLLAEVRGPAGIAISRKPEYDDDDMRVATDSRGRLRAIGKKLEGVAPDAEAIGLSLFRGEGVEAFRNVLDAAVRSPESLRQWYTSALQTVARRLPIHTVPTGGLWWTEIDSPADLEQARAALRPGGAARRRETRRDSSTHSSPRAGTWTPLEAISAPTGRS